MLNQRCAHGGGREASQGPRGGAGARLDGGGEPPGPGSAALRAGRRRLPDVAARSGGVVASTPASLPSRSNIRRPRAHGAYPPRANGGVGRVGHVPAPPFGGLSSECHRLRGAWGATSGLPAALPAGPRACRKCSRGERKQCNGRAHMNGDTRRRQPAWRSGARARREGCSGVRRAAEDASRALRAMRETHAPSAAPTGSHSGTYAAVPSAIARGERCAQNRSARTLSACRGARAWRGLRILSISAPPRTRGAGEMRHCYRANARLGAGSRLLPGRFMGA